jgi:hypothetical protein
MTMAKADEILNLDVVGLAAKLRARALFARQARAHQSSCLTRRGLHAAE